MVEDATTTIRISAIDRDRLAKLGTKDDTFADIIKRLLDERNGQNNRIKD